MLIIEVNEQNVKVDGAIYPTPMTANAHQFNELLIEFQWNGNVEYRVDYHEVKILDKEGGVLADGKTSTRNQIIQAFNNLANNS